MTTLPMNRLAQKNRCRNYGRISRCLLQIKAVIAEIVADTRGPSHSPVSSVGFDPARRRAMGAKVTTAERPAASAPVALLAEIQTLARAVAAEGRVTYRTWRPHLRRPGIAASMLNFAQYLALRRRDLRPLQEHLMRYGLSSLGRLEGRVMVTLEAVEGALTAAIGAKMSRTRPWPPAERRFIRGQRSLVDHTDSLFGPAPTGRRTRILVTLPSEAAEDPSFLHNLARHGVDAVRINCAHDGPEAWIAMARHTRAASSTHGRDIKVLMDIAGPKLRTGAVRHPEGEKRLKPGDRLLLVRNAGDLDAPSDIGFRAVCEPPEVLNALSLGKPVALDDGKLRTIVEALGPSGSVIVRVEHSPLEGFKLRPEKGLNFPGVELGLPALSIKDLEDLSTIARHADMVGHSFVQSAADVSSLQAALAERQSAGTAPLGIIAKIETIRAVRNLPEIIVEAAGRQPFGVKIARGDLAVEIGFTRLAEIQEEILWLCEAASVPVVWATQVLEEMVKSGLPTRGEMTDAAMSGRAECVMLNKGQNVGAAIDVLDALLRRMAEHQTKKTYNLRALHSW